MRTRTLAFWVVVLLGSAGATFVLVRGTRGPPEQPAAGMEAGERDDPLQGLKALLRADRTLKAELISMEKLVPEIKEVLAATENGHCDAALEKANALASASPGEARSTLLLAHAKSACGDRPGAVGLLRTSLESAKGSSHATLQTWHWLRELGAEPPPEIAGEVLGLIVDLAFPDGVDTIAAYADGSSRYFSKAGGAILGDDVRPDVQGAARRSISVASEYVKQATRAEGSSGLKTGTARFTFLTPGGRLELETTVDELKAGTSKLMPLFVPLGMLKMLKIRGREAP